MKRQVAGFWRMIPALAAALLLANPLTFAQSDPLPSWNDTASKKAKEPFASALRGDRKEALSGGIKAILEMAMATHAGMSTEAFGQMVIEWLGHARHPAPSSGSAVPFDPCLSRAKLQVVAVDPVL
jgi:hypothetical protein